MSHWYDYEQRFYDGLASTVSSNSTTVGQSLTDYGTPYVFTKTWDDLKKTPIDAGSKTLTATPVDMTICPANQENYCDHTVIWAQEDDSSFTIVSKDLRQRWHKDGVIAWSDKKIGWVVKCNKSTLVNAFGYSSTLWCNEYTEETANAILEFNKQNSHKPAPLPQYYASYGDWNVYVDNSAISHMENKNEFEQNLKIVREKATSLSEFINSRKCICTVNQPTKLPTFQTMFSGGVGEKMDMSLLNFIGGEKFELKYCYIAEEHGENLDTLGYDSVIFRFYSKDLDKYLDLHKNQCDKLLDNFKNFFQTYEEHMAKEEEKKIRRERRKLAKQEKEELEKIAIMATEESKGFGAWS